VPAADRIDGRGEDNAPRSIVRSSKAETRVVKTRHPPASFASSGPEPLGARPRAPARGRRATTPRGRARRRNTLRDEQTDGDVGAWRREHATCGVLEARVRKCRRRFGRIAAATPESHARAWLADTRGLARTTPDSRGDARIGGEDERIGAGAPPHATQKVARRGSVERAQATPGATPRRGAGPGTREVPRAASALDPDTKSGCSARGRVPPKPGRRGRAPGSTVKTARARDSARPSWRRGRNRARRCRRATRAPRGRIDSRTAPSVVYVREHPRREGSAPTAQSSRVRSERRRCAEWRSRPPRKVVPSREAWGRGVHRDRVDQSGRTAKAPPPRRPLAARTAWGHGRTPDRFDDACAWPVRTDERGRARDGLAIDVRKSVVPRARNGQAERSPRSS